MTREELLKKAAETYAEAANKHTGTRTERLNGLRKSFF